MATSATYGTALYGSSQYGIVFVTSNAGAYTITGGAASFRYDYATQAASGSYSITGGSASLLVSHILGSDAGAYAITGYAATILHNEVIYAGYWQFALVGYDAALTTNHLLAAETGVYALAGGDAALARSLVLFSDAGSYSQTGYDAILTYEVPTHQTTGGVEKKVKTKIKKSQRDEVEAIVREAFDKMDGTYVPEVVVEKLQKEIKREIKNIDLGQYEVAIAQVNALLLSAKLKIHEYESELDDENALLLIL